MCTHMYTPHVCRHTHRVEEKEINMEYESGNKVFEFLGSFTTNLFDITSFGGGLFRVFFPQ